VIEFDVCLAADSDTLVVSHDRARHVEMRLPSMRHCRFFRRLTLNCCGGEGDGLVSRVIERLVAATWPRSAYLPLPTSQILSVGGCATGAPGHHRHVPVET